MNNPTVFYIALGSNKGDKIKNLQKAVDLIHQRIGIVKAISKVYKSPSFGFKSDDFFNACLVLESKLSPHSVLEVLLDIEIELGRVRTQSHGYESRTIDLDIVFADNLIIDTETLQVPHPEMHKRKFVLLPLNDLCPRMIHPKLKKGVEVLLLECDDDSVLEVVSETIISPSLNT